MLAAIFDLIGSRREVEHAGKLREKIFKALSSLEDVWANRLPAKPALTAGDSVEILAKGWKPVTFFFHLSRTLGLGFRVGLGAGRVDVVREFADECDGPAFWSARSSLEFLRSREARGSVVNFALAEGSEIEDLLELRTASLTISLLAEMPEKRILYCFRRVWLGERVTEIASKYGISKGNVSKALRNTGCFILMKLVTGNQQPFDS